MLRGWRCWHPYPEYPPLIKFQYFPQIFHLPIISLSVSILQRLAKDGVRIRYCKALDIIFEILFEDGLNTFFDFLCDFWNYVFVILVSKNSSKTL